MNIEKYREEHSDDRNVRVLQIRKPVNDRPNVWITYEGPLKTVPDEFLQEDISLAEEQFGSGGKAVTLWTFALREWNPKAKVSSDCWKETPRTVSARRLIAACLSEIVSLEERYQALDENQKHPLAEQERATLQRMGEQSWQIAKKRFRFLEDAAIIPPQQKLAPER